MACDKVSYSGVSPLVLNKVRDELKKIDLDLPPQDKGILTSTAYGVSAAYEYLPGAQTLSVEVTNKPFFVPCSYIHKKFSEALDRAKAVS